MSRLDPKVKIIQSCEVHYHKIYEAINVKKLLKHDQMAEGCYKCDQTI
jgi:cytochrome oxidase assembly protein ShyY1